MVKCVKREEACTVEYASKLSNTLNVLDFRKVMLINSLQNYIN